jgi:hypothetical protein
VSARTAIARCHFSTVPARALAFVAVLAAHAALLFLLWALRGGSTDAARDAATTVLLLLPTSDQDQVGAPSAASQSQARGRRVRRDDRPQQPAEAAARAPAPNSSSAPVAIDWAREAALAASRQIDAAEEAARKAQAFSARIGRSLATPKSPAPKFGWSYAHMHRFETVPGGILFNLNDRCVILLSFMLMPICRIGKIEERGDLFEHLHDPLPLGELDTVLP